MGKSSNAGGNPQILERNLRRVVPQPARRPITNDSKANLDDDRDSRTEIVREEDEDGACEDDLDVNQQAIIKNKIKATRKPQMIN